MSYSRIRWIKMTQKSGNHELIRYECWRQLAWMTYPKLKMAMFKFNEFFHDKGVFLLYWGKCISAILCTSWGLEAWQFGEDYWIRCNSNRLSGINQLRVQSWDIRWFCKFQWSTIQQQYITLDVFIFWSQVVLFSFRFVTLIMLIHNCNFKTCQIRHVD